MKQTHKIKVNSSLEFYLGHEVFELQDPLGKCLQPIPVF